MESLLPAFCAPPVCGSVPGGKAGGGQQARGEPQNPAFAAAAIHQVAKQHGSHGKAHAAAPANGPEGLIALLQRFQDHGIAHGLDGRVKGGKRAGEGQQDPELGSPPAETAAPKQRPPGIAAGWCGRGIWSGRPPCPKRAGRHGHQRDGRDQRASLGLVHARVLKIQGDIALVHRVCDIVRGHKQPVPQGIPHGFTPPKAACRFPPRPLCPRPWLG